MGLLTSHPRSGAAQILGQFQRSAKRLFLLGIFEFSAYSQATPPGPCRGRPSLSQPGRPRSPERSGQRRGRVGGRSCWHWVLSQIAKCVNLRLFEGEIIMAELSFKGRHFQQDMILQSMRWYLAYSLSYRDIEELMQERGFSVDHSTINRWVIHYSPLPQVLLT